MSEQVRPFEKVITVRVNMRLLARVVATLCITFMAGVMLWAAYRTGRTEGWERGYSDGRKAFCVQAWCDDKK